MFIFLMIIFGLCQCLHSCENNVTSIATQTPFYHAYRCDALSIIRMTVYFIDDKGHRLYIKTYDAMRQRNAQNMLQQQNNLNMKGHLACGLKWTVVSPDIVWTGLNNFDTAKHSKYDTIMRTEHITSYQQLVQLTFANDFRKCPQVSLVTTSSAFKLRVQPYFLCLSNQTDIVYYNEKCQPPSAEFDLYYRVTLNNEQVIESEGFIFTIFLESFGYENIKFIADAKQTGIVSTHHNLSEQSYTFNGTMKFTFPQEFVFLRFDKVKMRVSYPLLYADGRTSNFICFENEVQIHPHSLRIENYQNYVIVTTMGPPVEQIMDKMMARKIM